MKRQVITVFAFVCAAVMSTGVPARAQEDTFPNKVKTHIGELTFDHGIPTEKTSEKLYYELDYHRAVQTYLWSLPIVGQAQWRQSYLDLYDMKPNQMVYLTQFNDRSLILTANESTPYLIGWTNVKDKAAVVEVPPAAVIGLGIDFWQRGLADFGMFGPFSGNGGTWVITGPETPKFGDSLHRGRQVHRVQDQQLLVPVSPHHARGRTRPGHQSNQDVLQRRNAQSRDHHSG